MYDKFAKQIYTKEVFYTSDLLYNQKNLIGRLYRYFSVYFETKDVFKAGKTAVQKIKRYFDEGVTFNQGTTLCGKSVIANISNAKELGYFIEIRLPQSHWL